MKVWFSPYKLYPATHLNAQVNQGERAGALVKIQTEEGLVGYADFHRPKLLEDLNQFETLKELRSLVNKPDFARTLSLAERNAKGYQFKETKIKNHFLITDVESFSYLDLLFYESNGFNRFKVKMGRSLRKQSLALKELCEKSDSKTYFRLDFNASVAKEDFKIWIKKNSAWLCKKIDFIEDPVKYDPSYWRFLKQEYGLNIALDLEADPLKVDIDGSYSVVVVKPAVQDEQPILDKFKGSNIKLVWTHYMDHPLGQATAIASALKAKEQLGNNLLDCGLLGKEIYSDLDANTYIQQDGACIVNPKGEHLGFKKYLEDLKWFPHD